MQHLLEKTETSLTVEVLVPNPELPDKYFSQRQLESRRLRMPDAVMEKARSL
jgi:hypothetical protein